MLQLLSRLLPGHVVHELGPQKAIDNAASERDELARISAVIDELAGRLASRTVAAAADAAVA